MTTDKARKRAVRTRMEKTGERYAAARRHVVAEPRTDPTPVRAPVPAALPPRIAEPGLGDEALVRGTGHDWDTWFRRLDDWGAGTHSHREIAARVATEYGIPGWWAQTVTVGYERARGRRAVHQTTRGFEVSVSKTVGAPPSVVWEAVTDPSRQGAWLGDDRLDPGSWREGRWAKFQAAGDSSLVTVNLAAKAEDRSTITIVHSKLGDADAVARQRAVWRERLVRLASVVEASTPVASAGRQSS
ncbi:MAG TPA: hypothetical protein VD763_13990 [Candidatus Saccharimonadales bacterium]|nr:hypothetical protein [Candidatus Saccharimonadales bacterium]